MSYNSGHTAMLRSAQMLDYTSHFHVRETPEDIAVIESFDRTTPGIANGALVGRFELLSRGNCIGTIYVG